MEFGFDQFLVRKVAHWTEYFILGFLLMRALSANSDKLIFKRHIVLSVIVARYAVTDSGISFVQIGTLK